MRRYVADAGRAFERAPVEVVLSVILATAFSFMIEIDAGEWYEFWEFAVVVLLAGGVAFIATLLHALGSWRMRTRWLVTLGAVVAAALYDVFDLDLHLESDAWRAATLIAAVALLVLAAPALGDRDGATERFRRVIGRLLIRVFGVLLYATALYAGLALALAAINTLFELDLDHTIFLHVFGWVYIVLVTWVVVGGVQDYVRPVEENGAVTRSVHRLSAFLVTPLVAIYYVILYAYAVRIAVTSELPKNLVSPLVIAAGLLAGIALMLFDRTDDESGSFRSLRATAPLFLPLGALGIGAITMRLDQYGWTEFRALRIVLLAALCLVAVSATIRVVKRRPLRPYLLPLTLAIALALAAVGPWSAMSISRRSQQARLESAMNAAGLSWDATTVRDSVIADSVYTQIAATTRYLMVSHGASSLPPLFAQHVPSTASWQPLYRRPDPVASAGLRPDKPDANDSRTIYVQLDQHAALGNVDDGALHYVRLDWQDPPRPDSGAVPSVVPPVVESYVARIMIAETAYDADVGPIVAASELPSRDPGVRRASGGTIPPEHARVPLRDAAGVVRGDLFVLELTVRGGGVRRLVGVVRLD